MSHWVPTLFSSKGATEGDGDRHAMGTGGLLFTTRYCISDAFVTFSEWYSTAQYVHYRAAAITTRPHAFLCTHGLTLPVLSFERFSPGLNL